MGTTVILLMVAGGAAIAVLAFILFAASPRLALVCLAGAYLISSPLSGAVASFAGPLKYGRVGISVLMVVAGVLGLRLVKYGRATWAILIFFSYYTLASLWSGNVFFAGRWKGMVLIALVAGIVLAHSFASAIDLMRGLRVLLLPCLAYALLMVGYNALHPALTGRLAPWGINANMVGLAAAQMVLLTLAVGIYDTSKRWKVLGLIATFLLVLVLFSAGSRGGLGEALAGACILLLPMVRRPGLLITATIVLFIAVWAGLHFFASDFVQRLDKISFANRQAIWASGIEQFKQAPLFGKGWVSGISASGRLATGNMHDMYLNVLTETGVVGMAIFLVICGVIAARTMTIIRLAKSCGNLWVSYLAAAILISLALEGVVESATILGSTVNTLMLGLAVGLVDRNYTWLQQYAGARLASSALLHDGLRGLGRAAPTV